VAFALPDKTSSAAPTNNLDYSARTYELQSPLWNVVGPHINPVHPFSGFQGVATQKPQEEDLAMAGSKPKQSTILSTVMKNVPLKPLTFQLMKLSLFSWKIRSSFR
jgi:hypothetical protein